MRNICSARSTFGISFYQNSLRLPVKIFGAVVFGLLLMATIVNINGQSAGDNLSAVGSSQDGFVKRDGTRLTLNNRPYKFTGLQIKHANTLNWGVSCAEPIGTGEGLNKALTEIDNGSGSRAKVFRSWFFQKLSTVNGVRDWSTFDHTIAVAKAKGFKVIPVLGNQWAKCDGWESDEFGYKNEQWYTTNYKTMAGTGAGLPQSYRDYVRDVVTRYKDEPTIAMWQLINEAENQVNFGTGCSSTSATSLRNFTDDMGALVKGLDSNHLLSLGTIGSGQCGATGVDYKTLHALPSIDLCEYHDYGHTNSAMPGDQWNGLQVRINQCNALGKPIFIGETGITTTEAGGNLQTRAALLEAKLVAQFGNGVVGLLMWEWSNDPYNIFAIKAGDPILAVLGKYGMANVKSNADFDGDGKSDISVFRPSTGAWYLLNSSSGFTGSQFGVATDKLAPADFDADGKTDIAVFRDGTWYVQRSLDGFLGISFGEATDIPMPADFDGDGKAEIAVFRPSNGGWYTFNLVNNKFSAVQFGQIGDVPVAADYDGDGKDDIAVFRNGIWYQQRSRDGFTGISFGQSGDKPVPADYDGDGKSDIAVFRPENGTWYLQRSRDGFTGVAFGLGTDKPAPADYDGDGKADIAVFRDGTWYLQRSRDGFIGISFGEATDKALPNAFVP